MFDAVEEDESSNPVDVGFFRTVTVMPDSHGDANIVEQSCLTIRDLKIHIHHRFSFILTNSQTYKNKIESIKDRVNNSCFVFMRANILGTAFFITNFGVFFSQIFISRRTTPFE